MATATVEPSELPSAPDAPAPDAPAPDAPATTRSWQTKRVPRSHHVLGWVITEDMCQQYCRRYESVDRSAMDEREVVEDTCTEFTLPVNGLALVWVAGKPRTAKWAVYLTDSWGNTRATRRLPRPRFVDEVKQWLGTDKEPEWLFCVNQGPYS